MASENVSATFRVSPKVLALIDSQSGNTLTERFERLIYAAHEELPRTQRELERVQRDIQNERSSLRVLRDRKAELMQNINRLNYQIKMLIPSIEQAVSSIAGTEVSGNE